MSEKLEILSQNIFSGFISFKTHEFVYVFLNDPSSSLKVVQVSQCFA